MSNLPWFRLYHRIIDDEKIRLLAFEDRWHFIAVCCLKADGLLDEPDSDLKWRKVAVKLGVQLRELDEIKRRLFEVGLVDQDMQPTAWDQLQYKTDTSTDRVRKHREKLKKNKAETQRNVSVTPPEAETESEAEAKPREWTRERLDHLEAELRKASGLEDDPNPSLMDLSPIVGLIEAGHSLEVDILPLIRERCASGFKPRSWRYFVSGVQDRAKGRAEIAQAAKPPAKETDWLEWCRVFFRGRHWANGLGPNPDDPACEAPREIIEQARQEAAERQIA